MNMTLKATKALADQNRLRITMMLLDHGELCACQITELLQLSGATVSRHLSLLVEANILSSRKDGRWVYFQIARDADKQLLDWLTFSLGESAEIQADRKALTLIMLSNPVDLCRKQRG